MQILGEGLGIYSIAGYDTYAFVAENYGNVTKPTKDMLLSSRIGYQHMTMYFTGIPESFDQRMPTVPKNDRFNKNSWN